MAPSILTAGIPTKNYHHFLPHKSVCVIGGGVSGVVTARVLLSESNKPMDPNRKLKVTLFEKTSKIGGVWADNYTGFGIQVPAALYEFPDERLPANCDFAKGEVIEEYIKNYAAKHGVTEEKDVVRMNSEVLSISPPKHNQMFPKDESSESRSCGNASANSVSDNDTYDCLKKSKWTVIVKHWNADSDRPLYDNFSMQTYFFDYVVVATGVYSSVDKFIPRYKNEEKFNGLYLHTVDFKKDHLENSITGKNVIVVGYGKSAFDCAMFCANQGAKSSTLLFRQTHWPIPRKILGLVPMEWATFSRFGIGMLKPLYAFDKKFDQVNYIEKLLHLWCPALIDMYWVLVAKIFNFQFGLKRLNLLPESNFITDYWSGHGVLPHPDFFPMVEKRKILIQKGEIEEVHEDSISLKTSNKKLPADVILFGTGFKPNLQFLPQEMQRLKEHDGLWLYRQMIHPDFPGLVFLNSNTTTFTNITTASLQARWFYEMVVKKNEDNEVQHKVNNKTARMKAPSRMEFLEEINAKKEWKRSTMPKAGNARAYMMQNHQVHYYDELLKDMGIDIRRKTDTIIRKFVPNCESECLGSRLLMMLVMIFLYPVAAIKEVFEPYRSADYCNVVTGEAIAKKNKKTRSILPINNFGFIFEFIVMVLFVCLIVAVGSCFL